LSQGVPPALHGTARLQMDLPVPALDPASGKSLCTYLPGMDGGCFEAFLDHLGETYPDHSPPDRARRRLQPPLQGSRPSRKREPLDAAAYSPELNPVERWSQESRRALSNRTFETVEHLQEALTRVLEPYWKEPARLQRLTGFSWWVEAVDAL
jgi:hypothetical protein